MWIPREIEPRLLRSARTRPVVGLPGARQTGKTSTLRRLFPNHEFVSLDLPTEAEQAEKEPRTFLQRYPAPVIIDEVQYAPGLFRYLKVAVDATRSGKGQFLVTGSQKFTLMKNVSESLAGRADIVENSSPSLKSGEPCPTRRLRASSFEAAFPSCRRTPTSITSLSTTPIWPLIWSGRAITRECRKPARFRTVLARLRLALREPPEQG